MPASALQTPPPIRSVPVVPFASAAGSQQNRARETDYNIHADNPFAESYLFSDMPFLTCGLIAFLLLIFALQALLAFDIDKDGSLSLLSTVSTGASGYSRIAGHWEVWRLFLAPLPHGSMTHVVSNCVALFFVGIRIEALIGRSWYAAIFAASAVGGSIASLMLNSAYVMSVGASGAITGVIAALFVVSFHHRAEEHNRIAMMKTVFFFGLPALLPLAYAPNGSTDYYAHAGGAVAGIATVILMCSFWRVEDKFPSRAFYAARFAFAFFAISAVSSGFAAASFHVHAEEAKKYIPAKEVPDNLNANDRISSQLVAKYPLDARSHLIRGIYLADSKSFSAAERELRSAARLSEADPITGNVKDVANALLAYVVSAQGRRTEARRIATEGCSKDQVNKTHILLKKLKQCD